MRRYGLSDEVYAKVQQIVSDNILSCQTMLVEMLYEKEIDGFTIDDWENVYIDNSAEIDDLRTEYDDLESENSDLEDEVSELEDEIQEHSEASYEDDEDENATEFDARMSQMMFDKRSLVDDIQSQYDRNSKRMEEIDNEIEELKDALEEPQEAYEWWLVDSWLAGKLKEQGEIVIDNDYDTWWGRGTSGQSIELDSVIHTIAKKLCRE